MSAPDTPPPEPELGPAEEKASAEAALAAERRSIVVLGTFMIYAGAFDRGQPTIAPDDAADHAEQVLMVLRARGLV